MKGLEPYIIADTHFGHNRMLELGGRPEGFEDLIFENIKNMTSNSILIHLGDVSFYKHEYWHGKLHLRCPSKKKWLILGNHDKHSMTWYINHGWDFVARELYLQIHGMRILFTHRPQPPGDYDLNIHGHLHTTNHHPECERHDKQLLVTCEPEYKPISLRKICGK